jgi:dihydrofolate reductase/thymidylate synthase
MEFNLVVCIDMKYGIAKNGIIPWKIKEDSDYFRDIIRTKVNGKPNVIVSGRKTFEKMGIVKDHFNMVFTKNIIEINSIIQVHNEEEFFSELTKLDYGKIFICGGSEIYSLFSKYITKDEFIVNLYLNIINNDFECDTFIPDTLKRYCQTLCGSINPYIKEEIKNSIPKLLGEYMSIYNLTENNNHNELLVQNLNDNKYYNFIRFYPCKIKNLNKCVYNEYINTEEQKYIDIMKDLLLNGTRTQTRNGYTYCKFGTSLDFDLRNGYPLLTTKKMFFKGVCEELLFFLRGDCNTKHLSDKGIKIWEKNTDRTFLDANGFTDRMEGDMGPMYGFQWRHFNAEYKDCESDYNNKGLDQLSYVLNELKTNPHSRRIIMTTYNPLQAKSGVLFPCHGISIQFNVEEINGEYVVNLSQNQRSADYFLGLPFNIASYALLLELICHNLNGEINKKYIPGRVILFLGDYHIYESHRNQCVKQIMRYPMKFPQIKLNPKKTRIEDFELDDFEILNYNSYPGIVADMIA